MNVLDVNLKKCTFDMKKIDSIFSKEKPKGNIYLTYTPSMYIKHNTHMLIMAVYTYTHCGRIGPLAQYYNARLNLKNKNICARENTNPQRPKKI